MPVNVLKRGNIYHVDFQNHTIRGSLGTPSRDNALILARRLEKALAEGPKSELWQELKASVPARTFRQFSNLAGVTDTHVFSWAEFQCLFTSHQNQRARHGEVSERTVENYQRTLKYFGMFLDDIRSRRSGLSTEPFSNASNCGALTT